MVVWEALDALSHQLELCNIEADSRVVVLFDDAIEQDRVALIRAAVTRSGAEAIEVRSIRDSGADTAARNTSLLNAMAANADIIITTQRAHGLPLGGDQQLLFLADCKPHSYPPHANLQRRVQTLDNSLRDSSAMVITDQHGTELRIDLYASAITSDHGVIGSDHLNASFPAGWVASTPASETVNGELIIMPGDANLNAQRVISSPLRLQIVDDHVSAIEGDSPDADVIRALLEYAQQPSAYGIAEVTVGMNPGNRRAAAFDPRLLDGHLARLLAGVVTVSFGENLLADRACDQTVTLALAGRTVHLDDLPVVIDGHLQGDFAPDVYES